jgi:hypothetical protein
MPVNVFCKINSFLKRKHTVCRTSEMTHVLGFRTFVGYVVVKDVGILAIASLEETFLLCSEVCIVWRKVLLPSLKSRSGERDCIS